MKSLFEVKSEKEYFQKCLEKTGNLFVCAAQSVCEVLSQDEEKANKIVDFAKDFGVSFQIKNDIENFSNPKGDDLKNGIYTLCTIYFKHENPNCDIINIEKADKQKCITKANLKLDEIIQNAKSKLLLIETKNPFAKEALVALCDKLKG